MTPIRCQTLGHTDHAPHPRKGRHAARVQARHRLPPSASRTTSAHALSTALCLLLGLGVLVSGCTSADDEQATAPTPSEQAKEDRGSPAAARDEALQAEVEAWLARSDLVGVTAAVATDDGAWAGAAGVDGIGQRLVPQSAMGIGSVTKTVTAAEVLLLAEQGLVDLDAPVADYVDVPFDTQGATVRQLLSMRSGFPDPTDEVFVAASEDPDQVWMSADWYPLVDTTEAGLGREVDRFRYNNLNYVVLGDLIEALTGTTYAAAVRQDLLDPSGLPRIWAQDDEVPEPPLAVGVDDPDLPLVDSDGPWLPSQAIASASTAVGGMAADAPSLAAWGLALYTGQAVDPESVQAMTTPVDAYDYGLGTVAWEDDAGDPVVGHEGEVVVYYSMLAVWPTDGVAVAVLSPQGADRSLATLAGALHEAWVVN